MTEVERRLGQGPKSLRRVFCGEVDLKVKHIVSVLHILGMPEDKFFEIVAERRKKRRAAADELLEAFEAMGYRGELSPVEDDDPRAGAPDRRAHDLRRTGQRAVGPPYPVIGLADQANRLLEHHYAGPLRLTDGVESVGSSAGTVRAHQDRVGGLLPGGEDLHRPQGTHPAQLAEVRQRGTELPERLGAHGVACSWPAHQPGFDSRRLVA